MASALAHSASDPGLRRAGSGDSSCRLQQAGHAALSGAQSMANLTTSLYLQMKSQGKFKDHFKNIPAAGRSITVPLADSAERDVQPEVYFPLPATPACERRFRRMSHGPGEIYVHHGLKDQRLPSEDFRYGVRGIKGATAAETMQAGMLQGVAEYRNSVAEMVYESRKKEPLGKSYTRGHSLQMLSKGFGKPSADREDGKEVIFPVAMPPDTEEVRLQYRKTHNSFAPGERVTRNYIWPDEAKESTFRFGQPNSNSQEGAGAKSVLNMDVEDDGTIKKTRIVQKNVEDYRNVQHPKLYVAVHCKQGANGPPCGPDYRFGIKSGVSDYTAASCIKGYYSLEEQLPDQDLGRCTKVGCRNVTNESRAFGIPSVRTDIPAPPPGKRSCADTMSYGDECSAAALLNPQRFDNRGVPDREFLIRRPKEELRSLFESLNNDAVDFDSLWSEAVGLFDDRLPLVSLDVMLYLHSQKLEERVALMHSGSGPGLAAYNTRAK
jgi:EF-hand domain-containing family member B